MSLAEDRVPQVGRSEAYLSPAVSRLQEPPRPVAAVRGITEAPARPPELSINARLAALESRLAELSAQHTALVANLYQAHAAYSRLIERVGELEARFDPSP